MAAKKKSTSNPQRKIVIQKAGKMNQTKLDDNLILAAYFHSLLGTISHGEGGEMPSFAAIQRHITNDADPTARTEGFDDDGRSFMSRAIFNWEGVDQKILIKLDEYDARIRTYVERVNSHREIPITLKLLPISRRPLYRDLLRSLLQHTGGSSCFPG